MKRCNARILPAALGACMLAHGACRAREHRPAAPPPPRPRGEEIIACGRRYHVGAPVVLWTDPDGFDGYLQRRRFGLRNEVLPSDPEPGCDTPLRYSPMRGGLDPAVEARIATSGWTLADLQSVVDQFVIHYDACGASRLCFEVLHDVRGLSVHFMLDADGTIYQTLDLQERARHAGAANDRSIGVEIAQLGAYETPEPLLRGYERGPDGRVQLHWPPLRESELESAAQRDARLFPPGGDAPEPPDVRTGAALYPARPELIRSVINGRTLVQYDFTPQQYESLARLTAALRRVFPRLRLDVPRGASGRIRRSQLNPRELARWSGLLGHYHVTNRKLDPGPAFDWERLLRDAATP